MKKVAIITEGLSDISILNSLNSWFSEKELEVMFINAESKSKMIKNARKHYQTSIYSGCEYVIFLVDQNGEPCVTAVKDKIQLDNIRRVNKLVLKREMEAWMLADGQAIRTATSVHYFPSGMTDRMDDPKQTLKNIFKRGLGYAPTTLEMADSISPYFSIDRSAGNNTSALRFKNIIENSDQLIP